MIDLLAGRVSRKSHIDAAKCWGVLLPSLFSNVIECKFFLVRIQVIPHSSDPIVVPSALNYLLLEAHTTAAAPLPKCTSEDLELNRNLMLVSWSLRSSGTRRCMPVLVRSP
jgi:hypothetical protein